MKNNIKKENLIKTKENIEFKILKLQVQLKGIEKSLNKLNEQNNEESEVQ